MQKTIICGWLVLLNSILQNNHSFGVLLKFIVTIELLKQFYEAEKSDLLFVTAHFPQSVLCLVKWIESKNKTRETQTCLARM